MQQVKIIYFKASGKYYSEALFHLVKEELEGEYYNIGDRIRKLSEQKSLPGIVGDWLNEDNGFAVVMLLEPEEPETRGWPVLVKSTYNSCVSLNIGSYIAGADTNYNAKTYSFKQHGKYDVEGFLTLDENCISEGVALTHKINDKICSEYMKRSGYIMVMPPDDLSGCPHLILPNQ